MSWAGRTSRRVNWCDVANHDVDPQQPLFVVVASGRRLRHGYWGFACAEHRALEMAA